MKVSVIIPSLNPDEKLKKVVDSLIETGFEDIILVNDGSDKAHMEPFQYVAAKPQCVVLNHNENKGKGRALKTAFEYCINNRKDIDGVVTVDGDNQHKAEDILHCAQVMVQNKNHVVLGVRDFSGDDVPAKSRMGNRCTSFVFKFACGLNISDTQTGLRAIPNQFLPDFCSIKGERFEYETNMLLALKEYHISFDEVSIQTVYIEENASTHFNPIKDSIKIYGVILRFLLGSVMSAVIDLVAFTILEILAGSLERATTILIATVGARVISSLCNYTFNRKAVFRSQGPVKRSLVKYYILCVCQLAVSYVCVYAVTAMLALGGVLTVVAKAIVDTVLFLISFQIQRRWVFR